MELQEIIKKRRAYRSIEPVVLNEELIQDIASHAVLSASCFNNQPWRFVFVSNSPQLTGLYESLAKGNAWAKRSNLILAVVSKPSLDCQLKGKDYYLFDTGMATAYIILQLTEKGYVAHPIVGFDEKKAKAVLNIQEDMTIITLVIIGKGTTAVNQALSEQQKAFEKERPERLPLNKILFFNTYKE